MGGGAFQFEEYFFSTLIHTTFASYILPNAFSNQATVL
jgi:hypothetical protein